VETEPFAGQYHSPVTGQLWRERLVAKQHLATNREDATASVVRTPSDTRTQLRYCFSTDSKLRDAYRNPWGFVRHGMLLEDLDALAGNIAFKHCNHPARPLPMLVTASVDSIRMLQRVRLHHDITLSGEVEWVGRSSMLIRMKVTDNTTDSQVISAGFSFVARDPTTKKAFEIIPLQPQTDEETHAFKEAEEANAIRKVARAEAQKAASMGMSTDLERARDKEIDDLLAKSRIAIDMPALVTENLVFMSQTKLENSFICQPQNRNLNNRIFGGFLMRRAFEIGFSTAYLFAGTRPHFIELDKVLFQRPVDIGDLVRLQAQVTYATVEPTPLVHVEVTAVIVRPEKREAVVSNVFNFTYGVNLHLEEHNRTIKSIVAATREEALKHLEGRDFVANNADTLG